MDGAIRMFKKFTLTMFLITAFCAALSAQPKIMFSETEYDFGSVPPNTQEVHVFEFINKGTSTLHIKDIKAG